MSKQVFSGDEYSATNFYGGNQRGACVQITLTGRTRDLGYLQITREELYRLSKAVKEDIEDTNEANKKETKMIAITGTPSIYITSFSDKISYSKERVKQPPKGYADTVAYLNKSARKYDTL